MIRRLDAFLLGLAMPLSIVGQQASPSGPQAQLKLTVETATTDDDGNPTSLRVTITNEGGADVRMPLLREGLCQPDQQLLAVVNFKPDVEPKEGSGYGASCMSGDEPTLLQRIRRDWVRLRIGESLVTTIPLRRPYTTEPGTVEYSVFCTPAKASPAELAEVWKAGYVIPTKPLESQRQSFHVR